MIFSRDELSEIFGQTAEDVTDICVDSRKAKTGDLFVALKGEKTDGHNFIGQAIDNGAAMAISEKEIPGVDPGKTILVESSGNALLQLAKYNIAKSPDTKYIGVTGSVGKTTTKDLIFHILSNQREMQGQIYVSRKNFNSQIGLPICAATMPRNLKFGIFEMGMSERGDIKKLIQIVPPSISVISKICETHMEFFSSIGDVAETKSEIFETEKAQEATIIPKDSPYTDFLKRRAKESGIKTVFTFGSGNADAKIIKCNYIDGHNEVVAEILGEKILYQTQGSNNSLVFNSLSSILCANIISGISLQKLADWVYSFSPVSGRGAITHLKNRDLILVDETYNACPTAMRSAIQSLEKYKNRRKILVLGDMLALGRDAVYYHENLSATVDKFGIDMVFACGSLAKLLFDNLRDCKKGAWSENSAQLAERVLEKIQNGDCILVKGSNSMKMSRIVDVIKNSELTIDVL
jgi:UDP-N-acetylmuramoyl-tripeptide--D-alanyl-D-alanine ligase